MVYTHFLFFLHFVLVLLIMIDNIILLVHKYMELNQFRHLLFLSYCVLFQMHILKLHEYLNRYNYNLFYMF
nr:MAG TPA: hypothetical protein [Caudoviricetes sp.]